MFSTQEHKIKQITLLRKLNHLYIKEKSFLQDFTSEETKNLMKLFKGIKGRFTVGVLSQLININCFLCSPVGEEVTKQIFFRKVTSVIYFFLWQWVLAFFKNEGIIDIYSLMLPSLILINWFLKLLLFRKYTPIV